VTADPIPAFDLYAELEVSERASVETIQAAYRSLQLRNHPDRKGAAAGDRSARLNIARDWLTDAERRARYDAHLAQERVRPPDRRPNGTAEFDDDGVGDDHAAEDDDEDDEAEGDAEDAETGFLDAVRSRLRLDVKRLGRIWIVGLGLIGAIALAPGVLAPTWLRIAVAGFAVLVLVAIAIGGLRSRDGMAGLLLRWTGMLVGWVVLAVLAVEGAAALVGLVEGTAEPGGIAESAVPLLAVTALLSLFAVRRRQPPADATVDDFLEMTPREFETAVGRILGRHGYRLEVTGGPGDLVADLTGTDPQGRPAIVQCKRYAPEHPVGSRDVQLLIAMGVRHHRAERLVLVTTSNFTDPALDLADQHGVTLISGEELEDLTR
jgi:restriction system protein